MAITFEELTEQVMAFPRESRAQLADLLAQSLKEEDIGRIEHLWLVEAKDRRDEVRSGNEKTIPGEEALRKVREYISSCSKKHKTTG